MSRFDSRRPEDITYQMDVQAWAGNKAESLLGSFNDTKQEIDDAIARLRGNSWSGGKPFEVIIGYRRAFTWFGRRYDVPTRAQRILWALWDPFDNSRVGFHLYLGMDRKLYMFKSSLDRHDKDKNEIHGIHLIDDEGLKELIESWSNEKLEELYGVLKQVSTPVGFTKGRPPEDYFSAYPTRTKGERWNDDDDDSSEPNLLALRHIREQRDAALREFGRAITARGSFNGGRKASN